METATQNSKTYSLQMFASFRLGLSELAISVKSLQEVVNYPEKVTTVPLAPPYLTGIFNLRGAVVPIIDVAKMLGIESDKNALNRKVAIISSDKIRVGLLFDATSEILNVQESDISSFESDPASPRAAIQSVLKLNGGDRLIEVIDPAALFKIQNIKALIEQSKNQVVEVARSKSKRCQCITFKSNTMEFGLDISAIREIIKVPEIKRSVLAVDYCLGMVNLRGMIIPILDFAKFLKLSDEGAKDIESKRIVVMKVHNIQVGFLVDSVDSIVTFFEEEVLPIPLFQQERMDMMRGMLPYEKAPNVIFLNEQQILSDQEVLDITRGHASLYGKAEDTAAAKKKAGDRKPYISFKLDYMLSSRLSNIDEIAKVEEELMHPPGYPSYVVGMMKMRGDVVMVIDLRGYYGLTPTENPMNSRVLVVKGAKGKFGLLVDSVESIDTVDEANKVKIPMFLAKDIANRLQGDMKEVIEMVDITGNKKTFMILDVPELLSKLEAASAA
ncbi:chemotaxis protein CheW [Bdellovibrio sp. NC01]|uniref:chemotaxis protein CheW n=1 Tax=Bdellovibrio sp. NC01 TaxID=2220073 RepID=UPI001FEFA8DE|nr:chemotaxis protein CheW [Bdellovibrio sp. NC01]